MIQQLHILLVLFVNFVMINPSSEISGKWEGVIYGQNGNIHIIFNFKVDGTELFGTVSSNEGELEIKNGAVDGKEFTFDVEVDGFIIKHRCKLTDSLIIVKYNGMNGEDTMELRRVTKKE